MQSIKQCELPAEAYEPEPLSVFWRTSSLGNAKSKLPWAEPLRCLRNLVEVFDLRGEEGDELHIVLDNAKAEVQQRLEAVIAYVQPDVPVHWHHTQLGNSKAALYVATLAARAETPYVYMVENDYLHQRDARLYMQAVLKARAADYVTGYDHPDKYLDAASGGNPAVQRGAELGSRLLCRSGWHWKTTNSTTMTVMTRPEVLAADLAVWERHCKGDNPADFHMWLELGRAGRTLVSAVPALSTHVEMAWLAPLVQWECAP